MPKVTWKWIAAGLLAMSLSLGQSCTPDAGPTIEPVIDKGLPPDDARIAFASQCGQTVITCTKFFPKPRINVVAGEGQTVTKTPTGFLIEGSDGNGTEIVHLIGSGSGTGEAAAEVFYYWSQNATDVNPLTMADGPMFSFEADPVVPMQAGLHYVRLRMQNSSSRTILTPRQTVFAENTRPYDFVELEIEVRD